MVPLRHVVSRIIEADSDIIREENFELHLQYLCHLQMRSVTDEVDTMLRDRQISQELYDQIVDARAEQTQRERWEAYAAARV